MAEFVEIEKIHFTEDYYPRDNFDNETVNNYALNIDNLPPITISKEYEIIDGYHRFLAHRLAKRPLIRAEIMDCPSDQILWIATKLNSKHGLQLKRDEKRDLARLFFKKNGKTYAEIAGVLAISEGTLSSWLVDLNEQKRDEQKKQILSLYLQGLTQEVISDKVGISQNRISEIIGKVKIELTDKSVVPESLQYYNVWNFPKRDERYGLAFEGAIPGQIVENVLYYYTQPFDKVVDPMSGGGTTIDVCKAMYRRYLGFDLNPKRDDIKKHDIREGYPQETKNCDLIFLDPPYYNMVFTDLYKDIDDFYAFITKLVKDSYATVKEHGIVAFIIQDMTEKGKHCLSGESYRIFREAKFDCIDHASVPLSTQQFNAQQLIKAKEDKHLLGTNRDLYIFRKP